MAVLDTAIQKKPKHFNDPWMAGSVRDYDFFTRSEAGIR
jgi:hypothetical protein